MSGHLYLIPTYLSDTNDSTQITTSIKEVIKNTDYFLVENVRTARRFISSLKLDIDISSLKFEIMDKNFDPGRLPEIFAPVLKGKNVGLMSEAGLPGVADPGKFAVSYAHANNIPVHPLSGGTSIILALIASGFNGQEFTFHGYIPIDKNDRKNRLKEMETAVGRTGYTQLFMETPYRNDKLLEDIFNTLHPDTYLFIGADITGENEFCHTKKIRVWKETEININKMPSIFAIGIM